MSQNDMPLNVSNGNPEGSVSSFSKRSSNDNTPEQKVVFFFLALYIDEYDTKLYPLQGN